MVLVGMIDPMILPGNPYSMFLDVKFWEHCDESFLNPYLYLKVSFVFYQMDSDELSVRDVPDLLWWPPFSFI